MLAALGILATAALVGLTLWAAPAESRWPMVAAYAVVALASFCVTRYALRRDR